MDQARNPFIHMFTCPWFMFSSTQHISRARKELKKNEKQYLDILKNPSESKS